MAVYAINYDLRAPGRKYDDLYDVIQGFDTWCHPLESLWFVVSLRSATQVHEIIEKVLDSSDLLMVTTVRGDAAWSDAFDPEITQWLQNNLAP